MSSEVKTIAGMKVTRLLGKGGMSEVYEAENVNLGSCHAIKLFSLANDSDEIRRRFELEGRLLSRLSHPRIVKVVDLGVDAATGRPYFVMDLVRSPDGTVKSLADVQVGEVDEETVGRWYDDIREGLAYIHGKGVVHRDLKLQNILIGPDGHAVIADFGISRIFDPGNGNEAVVDPVQTIVRIQDGKKPVMGSLGYMAPEVEMGATATYRSDWYALGVIAFRLLTGTWCDSRTNVSDILSSYDPVWLRILPLLLHSNPEGRECLSYAEVRGGIDEQSMIEMERKVEVAYRRYVLSVIVAAAMAIAVSILGAVIWGQTSMLSKARERLAVPTFDSVFAIPDAAMDEETENMPSRNQFELAILDAQALTRGIFADLQTGRISRIKAHDEIRKLSIRAKNDDFGLFSMLPEGFVSSGEMWPLSVLLETAARRLK